MIHRMRCRMLSCGLVVYVGCDVAGAGDDAMLDTDGTDSGHTSGLEAGSTGQPEDCETPRMFFADRDADGHGDPVAGVQACEAPAHHVTSDDDCDDGVPSIHPDAMETCNQVDDDCDGLTDELSAANEACGACRMAESGSSTYWFCETPVSWNEARSRCAAFGADLVVLDELGEDELIEAHRSRGFRAFIGLTEQEEGVFTWIDGTPVTTANWADGQPDNASNDEYSGEGCVQVGWPDPATSATWNDIACHLPATGYPICEAELLP